MPKLTERDIERAAVLRWHLRQPVTLEALVKKIGINPREILKLFAWGRRNGLPIKTTRHGIRSRTYQME